MDFFTNGGSSSNRPPFASLGFGGEGICRVFWRLEGFHGSRFWAWSSKVTTSTFTGSLAHSVPLVGGRFVNLVSTANYKRL